MLRIEDTDRERSTEENVAQILDALEWLELDWDVGPVSQASRAERHAEALQQLLDSGAAYRDSATAKDVEAWKAEHGADRGYRGEPAGDGGGAVRLRVPDEGETVVEDLIRGPVSFPNRSYDDFVIARGDGSVLYNFAVAVDDAEMGITEVVRGDDHLSNTPKQLLVLAALGHEPPRYAHLPLLHGPDGKKLSKRHGAASVQELREAGYLPAAVRNYLALLGWGTDDDTTLMSTEELVAALPGRGRRHARRRSSTRRSCAGSTAASCASCRSTSTRPRSPATSAASPTSACAPPARSPRRKPRRWRRSGRLIRFLFEPPVEDEKAWAQGDEGRRAAGAGGRPRRRSPRRRDFDAGGGRGRARARFPSGSAPSRARSTSRSASRSPAPRSRRASSSRWPCSGARNRWPASTRRSRVCGPNGQARPLKSTQMDKWRLSAP